MKMVVVMSATPAHTGMWEPVSQPSGLSLLGNYNVFLLTRGGPGSTFINVSISAVARVHLCNPYIPVG